MARYFKVSISNTNTDGPFDIFYNTSVGGALTYATLYPAGGNATNIAKSLLTGGNTVSVQVPDNVYSIQVVQQSPYVVSNIAYPTPLTPSPTTASPTTAAPTTASPTTAAPTTAAPTTAAPTTAAPTTAAPTTAAPTTAAPTTAAPTTAAPTTAAPTTAAPTTAAPTTAAPTTASPTTAAPTTASPTTASPTTASPTTAAPTTAAPTTAAPTTAAPTTASPTTASPTTASPTTAAPTTASPTAEPTTAAPTTAAPTTASPTAEPTTAAPTTAAPTTAAPTTASPTTASPTTAAPTTAAPTTAAPTTAAPTTAAPTTPAPTIPPTGVTCYNIYFTEYISGECYYYPNTYESSQTTAIELSGSSIVDIHVTGAFTDGMPFEATIPAGYNGTYVLDYRTCGCYANACLTGNGIDTISVTAYEGTVSIPYCGAQPNPFVELFPTGTLFLNSVSASCAANKVYFNLTGGIAPYSASVTQDSNGNPIWTYLNIPTIYTASVTAGQIYYPAIADSTGTIVTWPAIYECMTNDITFKVAPLNNLASASIYYPPILVMGSQNKGNTFIATGSYGTSIGVTALMDSGTTFIGWSYDSGSKASVFNTGNTIQVTLNGTGSTLYALVERNVVSASFCYYTGDPIGTDACDACAVTKTLYYDGSLLSGSSYTNLTWFKDENLTTTADAGYYKLASSDGMSSPIYQVSAGPVQTKTLTGYCSDAILTC